MTKRTSPPCRAILAIMSTLLVSSGAQAIASDRSFTGRWRMDTTSLKGNIKPTAIQLVNGRFGKDDNETIPADGVFHPVSGSGYVDEASISVVSDHEVREVDRVKGRLAYTVRYVVSPDGNTLTWHVASYTSPDGQPVESVTAQRRVGAPTRGLHLISGRWERVSVTVDAATAVIAGCLAEAQRTGASNCEGGDRNSCRYILAATAKLTRMLTTADPPHLCDATLISERFGSRHMAKSGPGSS